jgi:hypothetical protein
MTTPPKDKNTVEADKRRDELAKRVLKMPPHPKTGKGGKAKEGGRDEKAKT